MLNNLGAGEIVVIIIIALVFLGSKKLKELARGLGEASSEIKKIRNDLESRDKN